MYFLLNKKICSNDNLIGCNKNCNLDSDCKSNGCGCINRNENRAESSGQDPLPDCDNNIFCKCENKKCVTKNYFECSQDSDCIKVQDGCCSCSEGGKAKSINKLYEQDYNLIIGACDVVCLTVMSNDPSCFAEPKCVNNYCQLVNNTTNCAKEGETSSNPSLGPADKPVPCCAGLKEISAGYVYKPTNIDADENGCALMDGAGVVCSDCGNGICESSENRCNCPGDCDYSKDPKYKCFYNLSSCQTCKKDSDCKPNFCYFCLNINENYLIPEAIQAAMGATAPCPNKNNSCNCINNICSIN